MEQPWVLLHTSKLEMVPTVNNAFFEDLSGILHIKRSAAYGDCDVVIESMAASAVGVVAKPAIKFRQTGVMGSQQF